MSARGERANLKSPKKAPPAGVPDSRHIENDVPPAREWLQESEIAAIRADCSREVADGIRDLVRACPPRAPKGVARFSRNCPTLYLGLLGQAFGLLHLYERSGNAEQLKLSREYLEAARSAISRSGFPPPEEWLSFHATAGLSAIAAVVHDRLGDAAESEQQLAQYLELAGPAADPDYPTEDLLWGRGGFLFGAAFLRAQLGAASVSDALVRPAMEAMIETGRRLAEEHVDQLIPSAHGEPPLLYLNYNRALLGFFARAVVGHRSPPARALAATGAQALAWYEERKLGLSHRYDLSLVHGLPGNLYLLMHFPELLASDASWQEDVRETLDCLIDQLDAERGMLELLPSLHSEALQARKHAGPYTPRVHWCGGTPGMVFVFARAYTIFGESTDREAAERAAQHAWKYGLLRKGNGICHGIAGNGYAFFALHRATDGRRARDRALHFARHSMREDIQSLQRAPDRPWSLYEGRLGTLCFYQDCLDEERARFPAFEV